LEKQPQAGLTTIYSLQPLKKSRRKMPKARLWNAANALGLKKDRVLINLAAGWHST
jgi:hypothetical protein